MNAETVQEETTLLERVVLLGVTWHEVEADTAGRLDEIRAVCNDQLDTVTGRLSAADTARALNNLAAAGFCTQETHTSHSPVGKGRPAYRLADAVDATLEALSEDDQLESVVERLQSKRH